MDSCEKISNSITAAKELIENETRSLAALHKAKQLENDGTWYGNCDKFVSEEQYKNLIDGKE